MPAQRGNARLRIRFPFLVQSRIGFVKLAERQTDEMNQVVIESSEQP